MKPHYRRACVEGAGILAAAAALSLLFSGIMGKGIFDSARNSTASAEKVASGPTFLTLDDARKLYASRQAVFIDARNPRDYSMGHISGAINLPLHDLRRDDPLLSALRKDQLLVVYCDGEECSSSVELTKVLYESGFSQVKVFFGGWNDWHSNNLPIEP
jgi:rhodanese-related sulfurtransferase